LVCMHTARWDHAVELKGKRVAVIGTGASGIQVGREGGREGGTCLSIVMSDALSLPPSLPPSLP
jgi:cation diffusion facilitator CzcD-associated flavoprotein CzcO